MIIKIITKTTVIILILLLRLWVVFARFYLRNDQVLLEFLLGPLLLLLLLFLGLWVVFPRFYLWNDRRLATGRRGQVDACSFELFLRLMLLLSLSLRLWVVFARFYLRNYQVNPSRMIIRILTRTPVIIIITIPGTMSSIRAVLFMEGSTTCYWSPRAGILMISSKCQDYCWHHHFH